MGKRVTINERQAEFSFKSVCERKGKGKRIRTDEEKGVREEM